MAAALQAKPFVVASAAKHTRAQRKAVVVCAQQKDAKQEGLKLFAAGLAAAALVHSAPALAEGIELVKPETRKVFIDDGTPAAKKEKSAAPAAPAAAPKKAPAPSFQSGGGDFKGFVLPASLAVVVGGGFALAKLDPGFLEMMEEAGAKDSRAYAGYETALKDTPFFGGSGSIAATPKGTTKKAVKAKTTSGGKKGGTLSKFFGK